MTPNSNTDEQYIRRCFALAKKAGHKVYMNPLVGAVIVHNNRVIGEGYHKEFGGPHAEIEALNSVKGKDRVFLKDSRMYVSLEPCNHHGKTPPCVEAIIHSGIQEVVISNIDPNPLMSGRSVELLQSAGVSVKTDVCEEEGVQVLRKFIINKSKEIPYIVLKWAQSKDRYIGREGQQIWLSKQYSKFFVHKWREELDGIMVGTNTVLVDNPSLTNRREVGRSPARIILDRQGKIPDTANVFATKDRVIYLTQTERDFNHSSHIESYILADDEWDLHNQFQLLYKKGISSMMIEGGAQLLKSIIKAGLWHEARIIQTKVTMGHGIKAPGLKGQIHREYDLFEDKILVINNLKI